MENYNSIERDRMQIAASIETMPDTVSVTHFKESPGIRRLSLKFDINELRNAVDNVANENGGGYKSLGDGFHAFSLTRRPGTTKETMSDAIGRYYLRLDENMEEVPRGELLQEIEFSELNSEYQDTYFQYVHQELCKRFPIGRMRVMMKERYNCNSWHRDPEPRLHIPIYTNPGALFVVNHHCTHLPADGSVYFTDTRSYHTGLNGGESNRVHIVAALAYPPIEK